MNFVAGSLLLFMDEEDAFWSLAMIVEDLLPGYFSLQMLAPQVGTLAPMFPTLPTCNPFVSLNVSTCCQQYLLLDFGSVAQCQMRRAAVISAYHANQQRNPGCDDLGLTLARCANHAARQLALVSVARRAC